MMPGARIRIRAFMICASQNHTTTCFLEATLDSRILSISTSFGGRGTRNSEPMFAQVYEVFYRPHLTLGNGQHLVKPTGI